MFERYSALFGLREIGVSKAVLAIARAFACQSALLRHEVAYVLGQTQHPDAADALEKVACFSSPLPPILVVSCGDRACCLGCHPLSRL